MERTEPWSTNQISAGSDGVADGMQDIASQPVRNIYVSYKGDANSFPNFDAGNSLEKASSRHHDCGRPERSRNRDVRQFSNPGLASANDSA